MNINDLTIGQAKELAAMFDKAGAPNNPYPVGKNVFVRTVTHHHVGRLVEVTEQELVLEDAAWVANDGRFAAALAKGTLSEVEPFPTGRVIVGRGAIIDCAEWGHALVREVQ